MKGLEVFEQPRAGGTDLTERLRSGVTTGAVRDIGGRIGSAVVTRPDGGLTVPAMVTVAALATAAAAGYPALAAAASGLATPQIRRVGTVGGNLLQHNRCWYYRNPGVDCLRGGGDGCPSRDGNHRYGIVFDTGPCVAPHPSTLGAALLVYNATVDTDRREGLPVAAVFGDGTDGRRHHALDAGELLLAVHLPAPVAGERGAYLRATARQYAEWPLVEAAARLVVHNGRIGLAAVAVGGVAPVPLRLAAVEDALRGQTAHARTFAAAAARATDGTRPLPQTGYKLPLLVNTVLDTLSRAASVPML